MAPLLPGFFCKSILIRIATLLVVIIGIFFFPSIPLLIIFIVLSIWIDYKTLLPLKDSFQKIKKVQEHRIKEYRDSAEINSYQMSTVLESIYDSILAIDTSDEFLFANKKFRKTFVAKGIKKKTLDKLKLWEIIRNKEIRTLFSQSIGEKKSVLSSNIYLATADEEGKRYFDVKVTPLDDNKGNILGAVSIFHDVTSHKQNQQTQEDFVANIGHELRTPLTAIKGHIQLIQGLPSEQVLPSKNFLEKIERNTDRLTALVDDISKLSSILSIEEVEKEEIPLKEMVGGVVSEMKQLHMDKKISVSIHCQDQQVWAMPRLFEQLMSNLLDNAFKYTPKGGRIKVSYLDGGKGWDTIKVEDSGVGIDKEHIPRIFERFYRADPSRSQNIPGTGLGLSIAQRIVQKHQGKIEVESTLDKGTSFMVKFPRKKKS